MNNTLFGTNDDNLINGLSRDDYIVTRSGDDVVDGGDGDDDILGNSGNDTLLINGYSATDATFARGVGNHADLIITLPSGDSITIENTLYEPFIDEIELITFSGDGVTFSMAQLRTQLLAEQSTAGDDLLIGTELSDTLSGGFDYPL